MQISISALKSLRAQGRDTPGPVTLSLLLLSVSMWQSFRVPSWWDTPNSGPDSFPATVPLFLPRFGFWQVCGTKCVGLRGKPAGGLLLPLCGSRGPNSSCQVWCWVGLYSPSHLVGPGFQLSDVCIFHLKANCIHSVYFSSYCKHLFLTATCNTTNRE